jgi:anti-sigma factor ChrR (cupin superfamily)
MSTLHKIKPENGLINYNIDLSKKVFIHTAKEIFTKSSEDVKLVIPLEREGSATGRTTLIVEYVAGEVFQSHTYPLGVEIFVLEGTFSDENGDHPAGTYIRNPAGTSHKSFSKKGCKLFVKLNQMSRSDQEQVVINTNKTDWHPGYGRLRVMPLAENTALVKWPMGANFVNHSHFGGEEILVLKGEFIDEHGRYPKGTWIRSPHLSTHNPYVEEETIIFVKTGHLFK